MNMAGSGLMGSVKRLTGSLIAILSTRLELLANELQEERVRLTQMLLLALIALFCLGNGLILLNAFIVVLFWEDHRLFALGLLSLVYLVAGAAVATVARARAQAGSKLFAASLSELEKDRQALRDGSE
jgi:uncharacterized membrane protein YqjE